MGCSCLLPVLGQECEFQTALEKRQVVQAIKVDWNDLMSVAAGIDSTIGTPRPNLSLERIAFFRQMVRTPASARPDLARSLTTPLP
jgi:hypothetical protein